MDREIFTNKMKEIHNKKRERYEKLIKRVDILSVLKKEEIHKLIDNLKFKKVAANEFICKKEDEQNELYILEEGKAEEVKEEEEKKGRKERRSKGR
ncbi:MAG: hypothetical protein MJ252_25335 [archaeon]|nr:hypothetical protein [archaeon]